MKENPADLGLCEERHNKNDHFRKQKYLQAT